MVWEPLTEVRQLSAQGRDDQALSLLGRYFETSRGDGADAGVRLSFALGVWQELAERHPPAREALLAVPERARGRLLDRAAGRAAPADALVDHVDFAEVAEVNRLLGRDQDSCALYDRLRELAPEVADHCRIAAQDALERCGRTDGR